MAMSYTAGTFAALVDAVVPETPALGDRGDEHVPGGLAVDLETQLVEAFGALTPDEDEEGMLAAIGLEPSVPTVAAFLMDLAALELLVRRRATAGLQRPDSRFAAGPFSRLSRRDRLRAIRLLETESIVSGSDDITYLASLLVPLTQVAYYSDWGEEIQGWEQADYPGPASGYAVLMGYEVETFEDADWSPSEDEDR